jgi:hypothetical protein
MGYALLQIDTEKAQLSYKLFSSADNQRAERLYGRKEKFYVGKPNIVVALVSTTAIGGIREAYPNYFADSSEFVHVLNMINSIRVIKPGTPFKLPWFKSSRK